MTSSSEAPAVGSSPLGAVEAALGRKVRLLGQMRLGEEWAVVVGHEDASPRQATQHKVYHVVARVVPASSMLPEVNEGWVVQRSTTVSGIAGTSIPRKNRPTDGQGPAITYCMVTGPFSDYDINLVAGFILDPRVSCIEVTMYNGDIFRLKSRGSTYFCAFHAATVFPVRRLRVYDSLGSTLQDTNLPRPIPRPKP